MKKLINRNLLNEKTHTTLKSLNFQFEATNSLYYRISFF